MSMLYACPICTEEPDPSRRVIQCSNGHAYCEECYLSHEDHQWKLCRDKEIDHEPRCPTCNVELTHDLVWNPALSRLLARQRSGRLSPPFVHCEICWKADPVTEPSRAIRLVQCRWGNVFCETCYASIWNDYRRGASEEESPRCPDPYCRVRLTERPIRNMAVEQFIEEQTAKADARKQTIKAEVAAEVAAIIERAKAEALAVAAAAIEAEDNARNR